jgi:hypothetical protein
LILTAIVGVEVDDVEWEEGERFRECGKQKTFGNPLDAHHNLPLGHLVNKVDMVHALFLVTVALMHRIHANIPGFALRVRLLSVPDGYAHRPGLRLPACAGDEDPRLLEIIEAGDGDGGEPCKPLVTIVVIHCPTHLLECVPVLMTIGECDLRKERDIGGRVAGCKDGLGALPANKHALLLVCSNEVINVTFRIAGVCDEIPSQQSLVLLAQLPVVEPEKEIVHPCIDGMDAVVPLHPVSTERVGGRDEGCNVYDASYCVVVHRDGHIAL